MPSAKMDWEAVWKSLNWDDQTRLQEIEQERLRRRARQYAEPLVEETLTAEDTRSALVFDLGKERYGIDVMLVRGVRAAQHITPVPGTPDFYRGIINLRGQIITVLDLRLFFGLPRTETTNAPQEIVLAQVGSLQLALLAHEIRGVVSFPVSEIKSVEQLPYAVGIAQDHTIILNLSQLFDDDRLVVGGEG